MYEAHVTRGGDCTWKRLDSKKPNACSPGYQHIRVVERGGRWLILALWHWDEFQIDEAATEQEAEQKALQFIEERKESDARSDKKKKPVPGDSRREGKPHRHRDARRLLPEPGEDRD
jgi:hypothetical protein